MWDTYRALHPLLCIIAPKESAQMMQSLVGMAEEGGWLPIFPCWNSYTAAMIGDHCSSVLADAYVKGIRNFDAQKAYRYMLKNATEQPATFDEYKNGMGRRALDSYLRYGYIPLEDSVKEAFHQQEQTSRTLEYAYDDFCVAQMAQALHQENGALMRRSENWRNAVNPVTGWADGRHADGSWEGNRDLVSRQPYITEGRPRGPPATIPGMCLRTFPASSASWEAGSASRPGSTPCFPRDAIGTATSPATRWHGSSHWPDIRKRHEKRLAISWPRNTTTRPGDSPATTMPGRCRPGRCLPILASTPSARPRRSMSLAGRSSGRSPSTSLDGHPLSSAARPTGSTV